MSLQPPIPAELWDQIPPAAQAAILALVQQYERRLQNLQKQVNELQQRLNQNSTNSSSKPPSSDPPTLKVVRLVRAFVHVQFRGFRFCRSSVEATSACLVFLN